MKAEDVASSPRKSHSISQREELNYTVWICAASRSHSGRKEVTCDDVCVSSVSFSPFRAGILCHLSTVWNLRNMPNSHPLVKGLRMPVSLGAIHQFDDCAGGGDVTYLQVLRIKQYTFD